MKQLTPRGVGSELVIGAAICSAGYFFLVDPMERDLASTREQIGVAQAELSREQAAALPPEKAQSVVQVATALREQVQRRSEPARSQAAMFSAIMMLADSCHVRIDQLQPKAPKTGAARAPDAPPPPPGDAHCGYSISADAHFASIAHFVQALQEELGLTSVRSVRLTPTSTAGDTSVHATIETEHWAFDLKSGAAPAAPGSAPATSPVGSAPVAAAKETL